MRSEKVSDQGINGYNGSLFVTSLLPRGWHKGVTARLFSQAGTLVIKNETPRYDTVFTFVECFFGVHDIVGAKI